MLLDKPQPDQLEISVFGPGFGECLVLHVGNGSWIVVDSCVDDSRRPVALAYLNEIGVDPSVVTMVVATHWHDDHAQGLGKVFKNCPAADLACSIALMADEFRQVVDCYSGIDLLAVSSGVDEIRSVWEELNARGKKPIWSNSRRTLWSRLAAGSIPSAELIAVTPTDEEVTTAFVALAREMTSSKRYVRALPRPTSNEVAVAMYLRFGEASVLLGSDVEKTTWSVVTPNWPLPPAKIVKVPHHGAESGHHDSMWRSALTPAPLSVLTPFRRGSVNLPNDGDVVRVRGLSGDLFQTAPSVVPKPLPRSSTTSRILSGIPGLKLTPVSGKMGHVRVRISSASGGIPTVDMRGQAFRHS